MFAEHFECERLTSEHMTLLRKRETKCRGVRRVLAISLNSLEANSAKVQPTQFKICGVPTISKDYGKIVIYKFFLIKLT